MRNQPTPIETGGLKRMLVTGSVGCPIWLSDLLARSEIERVTMIELGDGGRGVRTSAGWVSVSELRDRAAASDTSVYRS